MSSSAALRVQAAKALVAGALESERSRAELGREYGVLAGSGTAQWADARMRAAGVCAVGAQYPERNRYNNIVPFDAHLVKCSAGYVNASCVAPLGRCFLVAQAPLARGGPYGREEDTRAAFWRVIAEGGVQTVVGLAPQGGAECSDYIAARMPGVRVAVLEAQLVGACSGASAGSGASDSSGAPADLGAGARAGGLLRRRLHVALEDGPEHQVTHLQFDRWPNYSTPYNPQAVADLAAEVLREREEGGQSTLVHCSGGVGRSGAFVSVVAVYERLLELAAQGAFEGLSQQQMCRTLAALVREAVETMREQRHPWMVEGDAQFALIFDVLLLLAVRGAGTHSTTS
jgi:protein tyrosine phosphatase